MVSVAHSNEWKESFQLSTHIEQPMHSNEQLVTRRRALHLNFGIAGTVLVQPIGSLLANEIVRPPTPENALGPFYPVIRPLEKDADLTTLRGHKRRAKGQLIHLMGRVFDLNGKPVKGARIEIWQANTHGRYAHAMDTNPAPLDPNFQGYAVQTTDKEGRYRFKTIKPGAYPVDETSKRPPHIHFEVAGQKSRLVTQMFFPGEALNERDPLFQRLGKDSPLAIGRVLPATPEVESDSLMVNWDVVLYER
jgi:protocatechuate 3,4-dioxygenase beta subunit